MRSIVFFSDSFINSFLLNFIQITSLLVVKHFLNCLAVCLQKKILQLLFETKKGYKYLFKTLNIKKKYNNLDLLNKRHKKIALVTQGMHLVICIICFLRQQLNFKKYSDVLVVIFPFKLF